MGCGCSCCQSGCGSGCVGDPHKYGYRGGVNVKRKRIDKRINRVLQNSLFGSIVLEDDWGDFVALTRFERFRSFSSSALHPIAVKYLTFIVVLEGEVVISISDASLVEDKSNPRVVVKTFTAGQIIHLFPGGDYKTAGDPNVLIYGRYKLHFHAKASRRKCQIGCIDGRDLSIFLEFHNHLYILTMLSNISIATLCADCYDLKGLNTDQLCVLGPLLDLDSALVGDVMLRSMSAVASSESKIASAETLARKSCGVILSGKFAILEDGINPDDYLNMRTQRRTGTSGRGGGGSVSAGAASTPGSNAKGGKLSTIVEEKATPRQLVEEFPPPKASLRMVNANPAGTNNSQRSSSHASSANVNTAVNNVKRVVRSCKSFRFAAQVTPGGIGGGAVGDEEDGGIMDIENATIDDYVAFLKPGAIIGIEHVLLPNTTEWGGLSSVVCCGDGILGTFKRETLLSVAKFDDKFFKILETNFQEDLVESVCATVPLFFDMSASDRRALSNKIEISFYETGKPVYKAGEPGEHFYVVMRGGVEEYITETNAVTNDTLGGVGALYLSGQYFGEQSLVSGTTYPSTMTCVSPCLLLAINQSTYRAVFTNRSKLAEVNIRLLGRNVELQDILTHPQGYELLSKFVNDEHSAENLLFWTAADQFEAMVGLVMKQGIGEAAEQHGNNNNNNNNNNKLVLTTTASSSAAGGALLHGDNNHDHDLVTNFVEPEMESPPSHSQSQSGTQIQSHSPAKATPGGGGHPHGQPHHPYMHRPGAMLSPGQQGGGSATGALLLAHIDYSHGSHGVAGGGHGNVTTTSHSASLVHTSSGRLVPSNKSSNLSGFEEGWFKHVGGIPGASNIAAPIVGGGISYANMLARQRGLLDFGTNILHKYILTDGVDCVNIPGKMRMATIDAVNAWAHGVTQLMDLATAATHQQVYDPSFAGQEEVLLTQAMGVYKEPQKEIYQLLKKDSYVRFRATAEFVRFIDSMNPYLKQDTSLSRRYASGKSKRSENSSMSSMGKLRMQQLQAAGGGGGGGGTFNN